MPNPEQQDRARFEAAMRDAGWTFVPTLKLLHDAVSGYWLHPDNGIEIDDREAYAYWRAGDNRSTPVPF